MANEALDLAKYPQLKIIESVFNKKFPYFAKVLAKRHEEFGPTWATEFERELDVFFGKDEERLRRATYGYGLFALDGLKLQKKFDKTLEYENKRYEDVKGEVYLNRDYMFTLYLPGILLSHYLWPHHYNQKIWFVKNFIPLVKNAKTFCDVGVGTGFYSREMLAHVPSIKGTGYDISDYSLEHTQMMIDRWDFTGRYKTNQCDIIKNPPEPKADCAVNVEVLEHLEDPVTFLKALRNMVKPGAYAFITAAIDAPNKDHIYLYRDMTSVARELEQANFKVIQSENFPAFITTKAGETVPQNGSFIVQAS